MMTANNVVRRHLEAVSAQEESEIKTLLDKFEKIVSNLEGRGGELIDNPTNSSLLTLAGVVRFAFNYVKRDGLELAFYLILKHYAMDTKDRKILEKASKTFAKRQMNRIKPEKAVAAYVKLLGEMKQFLETSRKVVREGKGHTDEGSTTVWQAGPFNLINTGGFDDKKMKEVQAVIEKAASMIASKGFSKICYGDIQVTNTVGRSNVLAFYLVSKDEMFVRANLKNRGFALHNIIHELGHRLRFKFMKGSERAIGSLYRAMEDRDALALAKVEADPSLQPKAGDTLKDGNTVYTALTDGVKKTPKGTFVAAGNGKGKAVFFPLSVWIRETSPLGFVSTYAQRDPEENFAEMFSFYVEGKLNHDYVELFEEVL